MSRSSSTARLLRTWPLILTFLYFANGGRLNTSDTASASDASMSHKVGLLLVCVIAAVFALKTNKVVLNAALKRPLIWLLHCFALVSCLWSTDPSQSLVSAITLVCFTLLAVFVSESYAPNEILDLIMITGAIAVPASIILAVLVPGIGASGAAWRGIFSHKQQCAAVSTLFLVTAIHWKPGSRFKQYLRVPYVVLCVLLIAMSQSRTGWILALVAVALSLSLWLLQKLRQRDAWLVVAVAVPVVSGVLYGMSLISEMLLRGIGKDPTLNERTVIWNAVWIEVLRHPLLGYGYEAFWRGLKGDSINVVLMSGWEISQAQSGYLDLLLQLGLLGIAALALMTFRATLDAATAFRKGEDGRFICWCIVAVLGSLMYNVGESDFGYLKMLWFSFVLACIGLAKQAESVRAKELIQRESERATLLPKTYKAADYVLAPVSEI